MGQDPSTDQEPDAVKVAALAPVMVAGGKPTHKRKNQRATTRRKFSVVCDGLGGSKSPGPFAIR